MTATYVALEPRMPSMHAPARPRRLTRRRQRTRGSWAAIALTCCAVPSGESSSTKIASQATPPSAVSSLARSGATLPRSLNVGTITDSSIGPGDGGLATGRIWRPATTSIAMARGGTARAREPSRIFSADAGQRFVEKGRQLGDDRFEREDGVDPSGERRPGGQGDVLQMPAIPDRRAGPVVHERLGARAIGLASDQAGQALGEDQAAQRLEIG